MFPRFFTILFSLGLVLSACNEDVEFKFKVPQKIKIDEILNLNITETNGKAIDSVQFFLDGNKISSENNTDLSLTDKVLGYHLLSAHVFSEGKLKALNNKIYFLATKPPVLYSFEIVNTYPHDPNAFTQGFEYHNGFIYESTGQHGESSIRKTEIKTGEILQIQDLDKAFFGEGITLFNNKIHQLTWQAKKGFVYDLDSFENIGEFDYGKSKEGWGLTHNNSELIKSDGTERLWFLDPETHKEKYYIEAYTNKRKAEQLNEIEYINGKIYANIWQKNTIVIIDSKNGTIEGVVNLNKLTEQISQATPNHDYVLNGIAYDQENDRLFVTGKNWNKTFEIKLFPKN
jgi:glutamine cyclotransferase